MEYRKACQTANKLITESRQNHYKQKLEECDFRRRWQTAKDLLHSNDNVSLQSESENVKLCSEFSKFFINQITDLRISIAARLKSLSLLFFPVD